MRNEGDQRAWHAAFGGQLDSAADYRGVSTMHAVEHSDGHHARSEAVWDVVEAVQPLHVAEAYRRDLAHLSRGR